MLFYKNIIAMATVFCCIGLLAQTRTALDGLIRRAAA